MEFSQKEKEKNSSKYVVANCNVINRACENFECKMGLYLFYFVKLSCLTYY